MTSPFETLADGVMCQVCLTLVRLIRLTASTTIAGTLLKATCARLLALDAVDISQT